MSTRASVGTRRLVDSLRAPFHQSEIKCLLQQVG